MKKNLFIVLLSAFGLGVVVGGLLFIRSKIDWEIMTLLETDELNDLGYPYATKRSSHNVRK